MRQYFNFTALNLFNKLNRNNGNIMINIIGFIKLIAAYSSEYHDNFTEIIDNINKSSKLLKVISVYVYNANSDVIPINNNDFYTKKIRLEKKKILPSITERINKWVMILTHGVITDIIRDVKPPQKSRLMVASDYDLQWTNGFNDIGLDCFYSTHGTKFEFDFMSRTTYDKLEREDNIPNETECFITEDYPKYELESVMGEKLRATIVKLPCTTGESMILYMPNDHKINNENFDFIIQNLMKNNGEIFETLLDSFEEVKCDVLKIPKFHITYTDDDVTTDISNEIRDSKRKFKVNFVDRIYVNENGIKSKRKKHIKNKCMYNNRNNKKLIYDKPFLFFVLSKDSYIVDLGIFNSPI